MSWSLPSNLRVDVELNPHTRKPTANVELVELRQLTHTQVTLTAAGSDT